jgi:hypothetical protein
MALARVRMRAVGAAEDAVLVTHKPVLARRDVAIAVTHSPDSPRKQRRGSRKQKTRWRSESSYTPFVHLTDAPGQGSR